MINGVVFLSCVAIWLLKIRRWCLQADVLATVQKGDYPKFPDLIQINQLLGMDEDYRLV